MVLCDLKGRDIPSLREAILSRSLQSVPDACNTTIEGRLVSAAVIAGLAFMTAFSAGIYG